MSAQPPAQLKRELGVFGAIMMGLGAMLGTGVFVSIGVAVNVSGSLVLLAVAVAGFVALCNALSSAQLAASHPVSGGTYEYGYQYLTPSLGFSAGWMFLCAKSASAATAALGFAGYFLSMLGMEKSSPVAIAMITVVAVTVLVLSGMRRSNIANIVIVSITLAALMVFVWIALPMAFQTGETKLSPLLPSSADTWQSLLQAAALMFVAYTGYGRIATMGEEVKDPTRSIPKAILATIAVSLILYLGVAVGLSGARNGGVSFSNAAPLEGVLKMLEHPSSARFVAVGAMTAMLGVLLNLVLGLSRVLLAMGRRRDVPATFSRLDKSGSTPTPAVIAVGGLILVLCLVGDVKLTWSFSAFTVLVYYAVTNLAALKMPRHSRRYPALFSWVGLISCVFLAFWVERTVWIFGLGLLGAGLIWQRFAARRWKLVS